MSHPLSSRPRLTLFLPTLGGGGAERVLLNLARGLVERGHPVDLAVASPLGPLADALPPGVRLVDLGAGRVLRAVRPLAAYLRRERPAALLSALPHANLAAVGAWERAGRPCRLFLSEHLDPISWLAHAPLRERWIFPVLMRLAYRRATGVVAVSAGVADGLARLTGLPRERVTVIHNPIVSPEIAQQCAQDLCHAWLRPGEPPVVIAVGRLTAQKDPHTLLRAFALLRTWRPARLLLLGEGELRADLERLARTLGVSDSVSFAGFQPNPFAFLARAAVLALSSRWEGFGNVLVEALACGTQVVSTDCPSGPREILADGRFGWLVPVGDPLALAAALEQALTHPLPRSMLQERARDFTIERISGVYLRLLLPEAA